ncbi:MAG: nucleotide exchange factor GrpE [Phycisphaerae bacterium]|nr:nucleotide exchange factor GrpE [Phycisphaerae bacterium]
MTHKRRIPTDSDDTLETPDAAEPAASPREEEANGVSSARPEEVVIPAEEIEALKARCADAESRAERAEDNLLRARADFENYRRRARMEMQQARQFAIEDFVTCLLPILDNFERAIQSAEATRDFDAIHGGVVLILRQLREVLEKEGLSPIDAEGLEFDPNVHEAVMRVETDDFPDNHVVEEVQKGYKLGDKVLRACMVKVAKHRDG